MSGILSCLVREYENMRIGYDGVGAGKQSEVWWWWWWGLCVCIDSFASRAVADSVGRSVGELNMGEMSAARHNAILADFRSWTAHSRARSKITSASKRPTVLPGPLALLHKSNLLYCRF